MRILEMILEVKFFLHKFTKNTLKFFIIKKFNLLINYIYKHKKFFNL